MPTDLSESEIAPAIQVPTRWYGVYSAVVRDVVDPDSQGRIKVSLPWSPDAEGGGYEAWARLATLMAGPNRGSWFIPDVDDEVLVAFAGGSGSHLRYWCPVERNGCSSRDDGWHR